MQTEFVSDIIVFLYQTWAKLSKKPMSDRDVTVDLLGSSGDSGDQRHPVIYFTFGPKYSKNVLKKYKWESSAWKVVCGAGHSSSPLEGRVAGMQHGEQVQ